MWDDLKDSFQPLGKEAREGSSRCPDLTRPSFGGAPVYNLCYKNSPCAVHCSTQSTTRRSWTVSGTSTGLQSFRRPAEQKICAHLLVPEHRSDKGQSGRAAQMLTVL